MAKKKGSENRFPRLQLIEAAEDAGPASSGMIEIRADSATKLPYVIDDTGATTALGAAPTLDYGEDADIVTQDYDDVADSGTSDEVARADHRHGMPAEGGGGGGGSTGARYPVQEVASNNGESSSLSLTMPSTPTNGNHIILVSSAESAVNITGISQTNVTWTKLAETPASTTAHLEIWQGVVGASAGTGITVTYSGNTWRSGLAAEWSGLTGTLDGSATNSGTWYVPILTPSVATALVIAGMAQTGNTSTNARVDGMIRFQSSQGTGAAFAFPGTNPILGWFAFTTQTSPRGLTVAIT